jgi:hypothetical protein
VRDPLLPSEIRELIDRYVPSMRHLELLLLLRADVARDWTVGAVAEQLLSGTNQIARLVGDLEKFGLVRHHPSSAPESFRYAPANAQLAHDIDALTAMYHRQPVTLIREIYERQSAARRFADAFRLRDEEGGQNG